MQHTRVLVLNNDYQAISICSSERAFILVYARKAELVETFHESFLRTINQTFECPSIIRLRRFVQLPFRRVALTRTNIFKRDDYKCCYCGSNKDLTIDHVVPRSKGGQESWNNLITACTICNTKKGNMTPAEANMPLLHEPFRPSYIMYLTNFNPFVYESWRPYLMI